MEWGARHWSFFLFLVAGALWFGAFTTPYDMVGNRVSVAVGFGGDVIPMKDGGFRVGMWGDIPRRYSFMSGVQGVSCVCFILVLGTLGTYAYLCKKDNRFVQLGSFGGQLGAGILSMVAVGIYRSNSDQMGEGFWMMASAGFIFTLNSFVMLFLPHMAYVPPKWKSDTAEEVPLNAAA